MKLQSDDLRFAAEWLRSYDEDSEQFALAVRVAEWLDEKALNDDIREIARKNSIPVKTLKARLNNAT